MQDDDFKAFSFEDIRKLKSQTDWEELRVQGDHKGPQEFVGDWTRAELVTPEPKKMISLRVDPDVLDFFKSQGPGYQTRMNAVLRAWMEAQLKR
ncbi:MAG: BrnA antitoxin family protein [Roseinatronobacter sp.]